MYHVGEAIENYIGVGIGSCVPILARPGIRLQSQPIWERVLFEDKLGVVFDFGDSDLRVFDEHLDIWGEDYDR